MARTSPPHQNFSQDNTSEFHIDEAKAAIKMRKQSLEDELRAYREFVQNFNDIHPDEVEVTSSPMRDYEQSQSQSGFETTIQTFENTILDSSNVDKSVKELMSSTFKEEIVNSLFQSERLSPQLKEVTLSEAKNCVKQRKKLLNQVEDEQDDIEEAKKKFKTINNRMDSISEDLAVDGYDALRTKYDHVSESIDTVESVLQNRQDSIQKNEFNVQWYLYQTLDTEHPVLTDGTRLLEELEQLESTVIRYMTLRA